MISKNMHSVLNIKLRCRIFKIHVLAIFFFNPVIYCVNGSNERNTNPYSGFTGCYLCQLIHVRLIINFTTRTLLEKIYRLKAFYFRFTEKYIDEKDITNPKASAILQKRFSGLPPALIILAELDQNRDQGYGKTGLRYYVCNL